MKKLFSIRNSGGKLRNKNRGIIALALILLAPLVSADEFTLQGAMETVFVPIQAQMGGGGDDTAQTGLGVFGYSPNGGARFKLMANASYDDRIGLISYLRLYTSIADNTQNRFDTIWLGLWVKPLDWLRFDVGSLEDWTLWGKFAQPTFAPYTQRSKDEDAIFTEFYYTGVLLTARPVENLFIGVGVPALKSKDPDKSSSFQPSYALFTEDSEKAYERVQAAVGYTIDGIGLARFQYVGANPSGDATSIDTKLPSISSHAKIEGAFAYNGTEGLLVDVGFKVPIEFEKDEVKYLAPYYISAGARVTLSSFVIEGRADGRFGSVIKYGSDSELKFAPEINFHLTPSYKLDNGFSVGLDFGLEWYGETTDKDGNLYLNYDGGVRSGIGAYVRKDFAPGSYVMSGVGYHFGGEFNSVDQKSVFTIPIILNYTSPKASLLPK